MTTTAVSGLTTQALDVLERLTSLPPDQLERVKQELLHREDDELDDQWLDRMRGRLRDLTAGTAGRVRGSDARELLAEHLRTRK